MNDKTITIQTTVKAPLEKVWSCWNQLDDISNWAFASDNWMATALENDLRAGGTFKTMMAAKDDSVSFEFTGIYDSVKEHALIEYTMSDGRHVKTEFKDTPDGVLVTQTFNPETENTEEKQREGWLAILNNFKKYVEAK